MPKTGSSCLVIKYFFLINFAISCLYLFFFFFTSFFCLHLANALDRGGGIAEQQMGTLQDDGQPKKKTDQPEIVCGSPRT